MLSIHWFQKRCAFLSVLVGLLVLLLSAHALGSEGPTGATSPSVVVQGCAALLNEKASAGSGAGSLKLACVQPPIYCTQNSDCKCSGCCAQLGEGGPHVCQPTCNH